MGSATLPAGPNRDALIGLLRETWPDAHVAEMDGAVFFSLDAKHWPNFATIVWTDAFDEGAPSNLARPGVYRVNIGLGKGSFERLVGDIADPDYAALDRLMPHPAYAKQRWVSVLNPSQDTVRHVVLPLVTDAHDRLAARRERQHPAG